MAVDLFRLIDIRNRQAFRVEGRDGKDYRTRLITMTRQLESDLRNVLASNYLSTIGGPNYTIALRAYALEFAKIRLALEDLRNDGYIDTEAYCAPRADIVYQKVASLLGVDKDLKLTIFSSQEFCQFVLALTAIFFGGSTPANIVRGIELFIGEEGVVTLHENFRDARDPNSPFDISDQFGFRVDFELTEDISRNFSDIGIKLDFLLNLIKPAHTLYVLRFIFSDISDILQNADDTFRHDSYCDHAYDDMRRYCAGVSGRDRLGINTIRSITEDLTGMAGTLIYTSRGPISKDALVPIIGSALDVQVLVDGSPVSIVSVLPAAGIIQLVSPVTPSQIVTVSYKYWIGATYTMLLNNPGMVLPGNGLEKFPATYVLNSAEGHEPAQVTWQYSAWQRHYTAVLNDPTSLLLNEPPHKISDPDTGRLYGHRHVLNWANFVLSEAEPAHALNEGVPIVELRQATDPVWEYETEFDVPDNPGWGVAPWGSNPLGWGSPLLEESEQIDFPQWVQISAGGKFISPLKTVSVSEGEEGLLTIACDNGLQSMDILTPYEDAFEFKEIPFCDEDGLFIFNQSDLNGTDLLNNFSGVAGCELSIELETVTPFEDTSSVPSTAMDDPPHELEVGGLSENKVSAWDTTGMFIMNDSDLNGPNVLWDNEQLGHWNDEGDITVLFGGVFHLPPYGKNLVAGPP